MAKYASNILKQAQAWLGKKEADGTHKAIIDIYNAHSPVARNYKVKYTDSWCATFISAVAIKCGCTDIIPTECGCQQMIALFKELGAWVENDAYTPNPGDVIFYDWQDNGKGDNTGWSDHVGYVETVSNGKIVVIEGNYSDSVKRRTIAVNAKNIRGYGVPKYDAEPVNEEPKKEPAKTETVTTGVCYAKYTGNSASVDMVLRAVGVPSIYVGSWKKRKKVAEANGISNYIGTAAQNTKLITLAKAGKLKRVAVQSLTYYPKYTGTSTGIDTVLRAVGVPSSYLGHWKNRRDVAKKNGVLGYTGTAAQNTYLISLAKSGKLKRV